MEEVNLTIRFSGSHEQAARLAQHAEVWGVIFGASSGISIEFNPFEPNNTYNPYISLNEIYDFQESEEYNNGFRSRVVYAVRRHAVYNQPEMPDGSPTVIEENGLYYAHEDLLKSIIADQEPYTNIGRKGAKLIGDFLKHRDAQATE